MSGENKSLEHYMEEYSISINKAEDFGMYETMIDEFKKNHAKLQELIGRSEKEIHKKRIKADVSTIIDELQNAVNDGDEVKTYGLLRQIRDNTFYVEQMMNRPAAVASK